MARVRLSALASEVRGTVAATSFAMANGKCTAKKKPVRNSLAAPRVRVHSNYMQSLAASWRTLTEAQRRAWPTSPGQLSGFNNYRKSNFRLLRLLNTTSQPLAPNAKNFQLSTSITANVMPSFTISISGTFVSGDNLRGDVYVCAPVNRGKGVKGLRWRYNTTISIGNSPSVTNMSTTSTWPGLTPVVNTQWIYIRVVIWRQSTAQVVSVVTQQILP